MQKIIASIAFSVALAATAFQANAHWPRACVNGDYNKPYSVGKKLNGQICKCTGIYSKGESRDQPPREWHCDWK